MPIVDKCIGAVAVGAVVAVVVVSRSSSGFCNMLPRNPYSNPMVVDPKLRSDSAKSNNCDVFDVAAVVEYAVRVIRVGHIFHQLKYFVFVIPAVLFTTELLNEAAEEEAG